MNTLVGSGILAIEGLRKQLDTIEQHLPDVVIEGGMSGANVMDTWLDSKVRDEIEKRYNPSLMGGLSTYGVLVRLPNSLPGSLPGTGVYGYVGLAPYKTAGRGSNVYCHLIGTFGVSETIHNQPLDGRNTFLMRFRDVTVVSPELINAIVNRVTQGYWLGQSNDVAQENLVKFKYHDVLSTLIRSGTMWP